VRKSAPRAAVELVGVRAAGQVIGTVLAGDFAPKYRRTPRKVSAPSAKQKPTPCILPELTTTSLAAVPLRSMRPTIVPPFVKEILPDALLDRRVTAGDSTTGSVLDRHRETTVQAGADTDVVGSDHP